MKRMKSAFEKAMERVEQMEEPRKEQILEWRLIPLGQRLAGTYIKGVDEVFEEVEKFDAGEQAYVRKGMIQVLVSNVQMHKCSSYPLRMGFWLKFRYKETAHIPYFFLFRF